MSKSETTLIASIRSMDNRELCILVGLLMPPAFALLVYFSVEPFSLLSGASIWPAEFIKMLALWLSVFLLVTGAEKLKEVGGKIEEEFKFSDADTMDGSDDIRLIWKKYCDFTDWSERRRRVWPLAFFWYALCLVLYLIQTPNIPARGPVAYWADIGLTQLTFLSFAVVFAYVSDALVHCNRLIDKLIEVDTYWPTESESQADTAVNKTICDPVAEVITGIKREWFEIKLIAMRSGDISKTVYYPIYIILLLLAAQSDYFDNFDMPVSLMLIASLNIALVLILSISLRHKAVCARNVSLARLEKYHGELLQKDSGKERDKAMEKLSYYRGLIENCREGAFLPISEQPWLRALTLMGGGGSSLLLLQYLAG